jgi:hypothetical protein
MIKLSPITIMVKGRPAVAKQARSRTQTQIDEASAPDDGETFDLNVSGSDSEEGIPARQPHRHVQDGSGATPAEVPVQQINDPTPTQGSKRAAADVHYFFVRRGPAENEKQICTGCE